MLMMQVRWPLEEGVPDGVEAAGKWSSAARLCSRATLAAVARPLAPAVVWCGSGIPIILMVLNKPPFGVGTGPSEYTRAVRRVLGVRDGRHGGVACVCGRWGGGLQV